MYFRPVFCYMVICVLVVAVAPPVTADIPDTKQQSPTTASSDPRDEKLWKKAMDIHRKSVVVDTHNDILSMMTDD
ncbi:MAG: hypothetical protein ACREBC_09070, partial [Pyrinomonadaceae bacterium]